MPTWKSNREVDSSGALDKLWHPLGNVSDLSSWMAAYLSCVPVRFWILNLWAELLFLFSVRICTLLHWHFRFEESLLPGFTLSKHTSGFPLNKEVDSKMCTTWRKLSTFFGNLVYFVYTLALQRVLKGKAQEEQILLLHNLPDSQKIQVSLMLTMNLTLSSL